MARSSLLTAGFVLIWAATLPAYAAQAEDQSIRPLPVATQAPTPLHEPHAVDQAPLPPPQQATPAKPAEPSAPRRPATAKSGAKTTSEVAAKPKPNPDIAEQTARPKARPAPPQVAAKPAAPAHPQIAAKPKSRKLAKAPRPPRREARRRFEFAEERPHSGPVYPTPPVASPPPANGCDETCQYRDWLNRYAAWYRDFGRYYYGAPPWPEAPRRPAPPVTYGENRPPPPAYRPDQSERARDRDRLDPWHGYNPHSPANGY